MQDIFSLSGFEIFVLPQLGHLLTICMLTPFYEVLQDIINNNTDIDIAKQVSITNFS